MKHASILTALFLAHLAGSACAAASAWIVSFSGPGGHSSGDYGNVSAVHAGARAVMMLSKALPDAVIAGMRGGVSVNAIAGDCFFVVTVSGGEKKLADAEAAIKKAAAEAAGAENAFRGVKPGDLIRGVPAEIRFSVRRRAER